MNFQQKHMWNRNKAAPIASSPPEGELNPSRRIWWGVLSTMRCSVSSHHRNAPKSVSTPPQGGSYRRLVAVALLLLAPLPALAQSSALLFNRTDIQIHPIQAPTREGEVSIVRPTLTYTIEARSGEAMKLEYIHTLNLLTDSTGVMITLAQHSITALPNMKVFTPVDALFVAADGTVLQISPNVVLGSMPQAIAASEPVKAFLFLKSGQVAARHIKPLDTISGSMFTAAPAVVR